MAKSQYEYVKTFEMDDRILPNTWIVVRVDGKGFHEFTEDHRFETPNDINAVSLMNHVAITVMDEFKDIILSYGHSDEYSFLFRREANVSNRRAAKILSYVTSLFTSSYVFHWNPWFPNKKLKYPPCFDGRIVLYPTDQNLLDYLSWRQADGHDFTLYYSIFWNLVLKDGMTKQEAENELGNMSTSDKYEMLLSKFNINYNSLDSIFRKGTTLIRKCIQIPSINHKRQLIIPFHSDLTSNEFWKANLELLGKYSPGNYDFATSNNDDKYKLPEIVIAQLGKQIMKNGCE